MRALKLALISVILMFTASQACAMTVVPPPQQPGISQSGAMNVKAFGAQGNCTDRANGTGCNDDGPAILAAVNAACSVSFNGSTWCTNPVAIPAGTYYIHSLDLGSSGVGGLASVIGVNLQCAASSYAGQDTIPETTILVDDNAGSVGISFFGAAAIHMSNCDVRTLTTATGPKFLIGGGKTTGCDCDIADFTRDTVTTFATGNVAAMYSYGEEDWKLTHSLVFATAGGHAVALSNANAVGGGAAPPETLRALPFSMMDATIDSSVLGVTGTSANPAAALYLDANQAAATGIQVPAITHSEIQLNGPYDAMVWDGFKGNSATVLTSAITGLKLDTDVVEGFNSASTSGYARTVWLGNAVISPDFSNVTNTIANQANGVASDGVLNGTTTFSSATIPCTSANVGDALKFTSLLGPQGGVWVTACSGSNYIMNAAAFGAATGVSFTLFAPSIQMYSTVHSGPMQLLATAGAGGLMCGDGTGSAFFQSGGGTVPVACPGVNYYGGTGDKSGSLATWDCKFLDSDTAAANRCTWQAFQSQTKVAWFDTLCTTLVGTCTTYPEYEVFDVTRNTHSNAITATNGANCATINNQPGSAQPGDVYAIDVLVAGSGCPAGGPNAWIDVSITARQ